MIFLNNNKIIKNLMKHSEAFFALFDSKIKKFEIYSMLLDNLQPSF
jgi:hypothetical protein